MRQSILFLSLIIICLCCPFKVNADFDIAINSSIPEQYVELPFVYPFNNKSDTKDEWEMTYPDSYGTNFGSINHAIEGSHHTGEDWLINSSSSQTQDKTIYAINHGVVVYSGLHKDSTAYLVIIRHDAKPDFPFEIPSFNATYSYGENTYSYQREASTCSTIYSYYLHLANDSRIEIGKQVKKGDAIGKTYFSNSGYVYPPHLHFEIYSESKVVNNIFKDNEGYAPPGKTAETSFGYQLVSAGLTEPLTFIDVNNAKKDNSTYTVRLYNVDDIASLYINGNLVSASRWGHNGADPANWNYVAHQPGDSGEFNINLYLLPGNNSLRFVLWNNPGCCYTSLSIKVKKDDEIIFTDSIDKSNSSRGITYDKTFTITQGNIINAQCDINSDGKTGLEEAIHALQIISGIK